MLRKIIYDAFNNSYVSHCIDVATNNKSVRLRWTWNVEHMRIKAAENKIVRYKVLTAARVKTIKLSGIQRRVV